MSAVFKGGTSLSKAHKLIHRFSEDVDIIVITPEHSRGDNDQHLKGFIAAAEKSTGRQAEPDSGTATRGEKRAATFTYPTDAGIGALRPGVRLELGARGGAMPIDKRQVTSLISDHSETLGLDLDPDESESVELLVLQPVRTLVEKLIIVHHAAVNGDEAERKRHARHYYDIWCLLNDPGTRTALGDTPIDVLSREVVTFTRDARLEPSLRPKGGFAASPAFDTARSEAVVEAFDSIVVGQLVWPSAPQPSFEECCAVVHHFADVL